MENLKVQGFYLVDVDVVALNNAGKDNSSNFDNAVATKMVYKNGASYPYVSGQAVRYWWRDSLQKNMGWELSPVSREDKVAYTAANPLQYCDDDVFGYMKAATEEIIDEKGKKKKVNVTVTRVSPLKNSALVSACAVRPSENWSSMSRGEGDSVPYVKQEYSSIMKGMFSLDLSMVGTFSDYNKSGYKNLPAALKEKAISIGCKEVDDKYVPGKKLIRLGLEERVKRAVDTIKALKNISGGAMQTDNMGDVTPKFIILATTDSGNHPFSHVVSAYGEYNERVKLNTGALKEVLDDCRGDFKDRVFIGRRNGFWDEYESALTKLSEQYKDLIVYGPINKIIDDYCIQISEQLKE